MPFSGIIQILLHTLKCPGSYLWEYAYPRLGITALEDPVLNKAEEVVPYHTATVHTLPDSNISYTEKINGVMTSYRERISCSMDMLKSSRYELNKLKPRNDKCSVDENVVSASLSANTFSI